MTIVFGNEYRDKFTGFVGKATAHCQYHDGRETVCLERLTNDGTDIKEFWFGTERLEEVSSS